jgi:hypothetical protein
VSRSDDKAERQGNAAPSQQDGQPSESEPPKDVPRMLRALSRRRAGSIIDSEEVRKLVEVASAEVAARQKSGPDSSTQLPPATEDSAATGSTAARPIASEQGQAPDLASANNKQASATDARSIGDLSGHSRRSSRALSDATRRSEGSLPARKETTTAKTKTKKDQRVDRRKREVADHVKQLRDEVKSAFLKRKQDRGDVLVGAFPSAAESTVRTHRGRLRVTGGSDSQEERQEKGVMARLVRLISRAARFFFFLCHLQTAARAASSDPDCTSTNQAASNVCQLTSQLRKTGPQPNWRSQRHRSSVQRFCRPDRKGQRRRETSPRASYLL